MASFTVNTASGFNFLSIDLFDLFNYASESKSPTLYRFFDNPANFTQFTGSGFTYAGSTPDALTAGTISGFSRTVAGATQYSFGGLSLSAASFEAFRASGDTIDFFGAVLGGNDTINGNSGNDVLFGVTGNDRLDGKAGADIMYGGTGNDTYVVDNVGDVVSDDPFPIGGGLFAGNFADVDTVESSISFTLPFFIEKLVLTGTANINGTGGIDNNTIIGNSGNNVIDGGNGSDIMQGGAGNDTYYVDLDSDVVTDTAGFDVVFVKAFGHTMGAGVENGTLIAQGVSLTGNNLANVLTGNDGFNLLQGADGNDTINGLGSSDQIKGGNGVDTIDGGAGDDFVGGGTGNDVVIGGLGDDFLDYPLDSDANAAVGADQLTGGFGNDIYRVDNAGDVVTELANQGFDRVYATVNYTLTAHVEDLYLEGILNLGATGNDLANKLFGNNGSNQLNGLAGADQMFGGGGNDTYTVDNIGDFIAESGAPGTDQVLSSVSYRLPFNVERLTLTGVADINGTGNSQANLISGNAGNNVLDGRGGGDGLQGGLGNDTYVVDDAGDSVTDTGGTADLVKSSINFTLGTAIENLELTGVGLISGTGNGFANTITGNGADNLIDGAAGNDTINGGGGNDLIGGGIGNDTISGGIGNDFINGNAGNDQMTGGAGGDRFVFDILSPLFDTITDFAPSIDDFIISAAAFGGGLVAAGAVTVTNAVGPSGTGAQFVYDKITGNLTWDTNGTDPGGATLFAKLNTGLTLSSGDFIVF